MIAGWLRAAGRWWCALLAVGLVLVVAGLVELPVARSNLTRARADRADAAGELASTTSDLDQATADIDAAAAARDGDQAAVDRATSAAAVLAAVRTQMVTAQTALDTTNLVILEKTNQAATLGACVRVLDGVRDQLAQGRIQQARFALTAGTDACRAAEQLLGSGAAVGYPFDFADPFVLPVAGGYLAFGTNGPAGPLQVLSSRDAVTWKVAGSALAAVPAWADPGNTWAPAVIQTPTGYVLYYAARNRDTRRQCISTAHADAPGGPYVDSSAGPFICQLDHGGSIDPSPFLGADGNLSLTWKSEQNRDTGQSQIWAQQLGPDGQSLVGTPVTLLTADQSWEGHIIEGPSMASVDGRYVLVYSGNLWNSDQYGIGYALCSGPLGPCAKPRNSQVLGTNGPMVGPGGAELYRSGSGQLRVAFHAWDPGLVGFPNPRRLYTRAVVVGAGGELSLQ